MYIWRVKEGSRLNQLFHDANGYKYVNIEKAVYFDNILTYLFGFCCYFASSNPYVSIIFQISHACAWADFHVFTRMFSKFMFDWDAGVFTPARIFILTMGDFLFSYFCLETLSLWLFLVFVSLSPWVSPSPSPASQNQTKAL